MRSRKDWRNAQSRAGLAASSTARRIYSSRLQPANSVSAKADKNAQVCRLTGRDCGQVTTGTPIHNASQLVCPPVNGNGSSAMSISAYSANKSA